MKEVYVVDPAKYDLTNARAVYVVNSEDFPGGGGDVTKAYVDEQDTNLQTQIDGITGQSFKNLSDVTISTTGDSIQYYDVIIGEYRPLTDLIKNESVPGGKLISNTKQFIRVGEFETDLEFQEFSSSAEITTNNNGMTINVPFAEAGVFIADVKGQFNLTLVYPGNPAEITINFNERDNISSETTILASTSSVYSEDQASASYELSYELTDYTPEKEYFVSVKMTSGNGTTNLEKLSGTSFGLFAKEATNTLKIPLSAIEDIPPGSGGVESVNSLVGDVVLTGENVDYGNGVSLNTKINANSSDIFALQAQFATSNVGYGFTLENVELPAGEKVELVDNFIQTQFTIGASLKTDSNFEGITFTVEVDNVEVGSREVSTGFGNAIYDIPHSKMFEEGNVKLFATSTSGGQVISGDILISGINILY